MRLAQEVGSIHAMMAHQSKQGGAVALPVKGAGGADFLGLAGVSPSPSTRAMYAFIFSTMAGKMACDALCSVLSRSNSQTGAKGLIFTFIEEELCDA